MFYCRIWQADQYRGTAIPRGNFKERAFELGRDFDSAPVASVTVDSWCCLYRNADSFREGAKNRPNELHGVVGDKTLKGFTRDPLALTRKFISVVVGFYIADEPVVIAGPHTQRLEDRTHLSEERYGVGTFEDKVHLISQSAQRSM